MKKKSFVASIPAAAASLFVVACTLSTPAGEPEQAGERQAALQTCGGIAGLTCPPGHRCVDDPTDDCDPRSGGVDCGGVCEEIVQGTTGGEPCGASTCGPGTYCCNASCGICAPVGGFCIQIACVDG